MFGNPNVDRWPKILQGFLDRACTQGMMEKGTMGELVARIIVIMARDAVFRQGKQGDVLRASDYEKVGHLGHARPFLVTAFLRELLTEAEMILGTPALIAQKIPSKGQKDGALHGPLVSSRPAMSVWSQGSAPIPKLDTSGHHSTSQQPGANIVPATIQTVLKGAVMNFNSFVDTNVELEPENVSDLCHHLLCGQAALQCSHDQPVIDIMIPIYCGDIHQNFDPQQTAALVIQVKNKLKKSPLDVAKRKDFYSSNFGANDMPLIVLTMDLSCPPLKDGTIAQRAPSFHENVFAFHLTGHTQATYKCVPNSAGHVLTKILNSEHKEEELQAACSRENLLFDRHSWASRYANVGRSSARLLKASERGPLKRIAHEDPEDETLIKKEKLGI